MKLRARPSPIKRGSTPQVRRVAVATIQKPVVQAPAAPKAVETRAPAPPPRAVRAVARTNGKGPNCLWPIRSEEHTSELQSLMRISYAVFCLQKKNNNIARAKRQDNSMARR